MAPWASSWKSSPRSSRRSVSRSTTKPTTARASATAAAAARAALVPRVSGSCCGHRRAADRDRTSSRANGGSRSRVAAEHPRAAVGADSHTSFRVARPPRLGVGGDEQLVGVRDHEIADGRREASRGRDHLRQQYAGAETQRREAVGPRDGSDARRRDHRAGRDRPSAGAAGTPSRRRWRRCSACSSRRRGRVHRRGRPPSSRGNRRRAGARRRWRAPTSRGDRGCR